MAEDSDLEKTEEPSERRLEQAREKGQVPHSRELSTFLVLMVASVLFWMMGEWFALRFVEVVRNALNPDVKVLKETALLLPRLAEVGASAFWVFLPFMAALFVVALLPPFLLNAWVFSTQSLIPDFKRMNPLSGLGRMFSWHSLMELGKAILKASLVGGVAVWLIQLKLPNLFQLLKLPLNTAVASMADLLAFSFLILSSTLFLVVAVDVPFQLWQHYSKLKMTKDEVKQETKEMMGDPQIKSRIRSLQMQMARKRMMASIPQADVIVTNPTHYAVALSYKTGMHAPKVVAKGAGEVAQKIKAIGDESFVPRLESPLLARSLYRFADLDSEIPTALYAAVAEVLAYIYQLSEWKKIGGFYPLPPKDLPIPKEFFA